MTGMMTEFWCVGKIDLNQEMVHDKFSLYDLLV
jgi:hypothetical protein